MRCAAFNKANFLNIVEQGLKHHGRFASSVEAYSCRLGNGASLTYVQAETGSGNDRPAIVGAPGWCESGGMFA